MRQFFKVISGDTFYMGKEGKESEAGSFYLGSLLVASVGGTERRTLGGERVRVVLFKIGTDGKGTLRKVVNFEQYVRVADVNVPSSNTTNVKGTAPPSVVP
jgi:hypothetical protein